MARAAMALLNDKKRLKQFKEAAARIALDKFNSGKIITEYENYYEEILNG